MAKTKLHITDERMLQIMEYCIANKLRDTTSMTAWCEKVGVSPNNISNIRHGLQKFGKEHMFNACTFYNINANYIFGFSNQMTLHREKTTPIQRIKEALKELEEEKPLKSKLLTKKSKLVHTQ